MVLNISRNAPYNQVGGLGKKLYFPQRKGPYGGMLSEWWRATVHGAIVIYPKNGTNYPFPLPHAEVPILFGIIKLKSFSITGIFYIYIYIYIFLKLYNLQLKKM